MPPRHGDGRLAAPFPSPAKRHDRKAAVHFSLRVPCPHPSGKVSHIRPGKMISFCEWRNILLSSELCHHSGPWVKECGDHGAPKGLLVLSVSNFERRGCD